MPAASLSLDLMSFAFLNRHSKHLTVNVSASRFKAVVVIVIVTRSRADSIQCRTDVPPNQRLRLPYVEVVKADVDQALAGAGALEREFVVA